MFFRLSFEIGRGKADRPIVLTGGDGEEGVQVVESQADTERHPVGFGRAWWEQLYDDDDEEVDDEEDRA